MANTIEQQLMAATVPECVQAIRAAKARMQQVRAELDEADEEAASITAPERGRKRRVQLASGLAAPAGDLDGDEEAEAAQ